MSNFLDFTFHKTAHYERCETFVCIKGWEKARVSLVATWICNVLAKLTIDPKSHGDTTKLFYRMVQKGCSIA